MTLLEEVALKDWQGIMKLGSDQVGSIVVALKD